MLWQPKFPSIGNIVLGVFIGYVSFSMWNIVKLFQTPHCQIESECLHPIISTNLKYQFLAYTSIAHSIRNQQELILLHHEENFDFNLNKQHQISLSIPKKTKQNGTLYLHMFLTPVKHNINSLNKIFQDENTVYELLPLTEFKVPEAETFSLLGEDASQNDSWKKLNSNQATKMSKPVTHIYSFVAFNILNDPISLPTNEIPYEIGHSLRITASNMYLPVVHFDQMSLRIKNLQEVTSKTSSINFTLSYSPISYGKLRLWTQFEGSFGSMQKLGFTKKDIDEVKGIFSDSNLYLLSITFIVSTLHLIFDFLAFKNDISFWRGLDKMVGISPSTIAWRAFAQTVIFIYLLEENTSLLVLIPAGLGAILEFWKVTKTFNVRLKFWIGGANKFTAEEENTQELDSQGFKYLTYVLYPLCIIGAVYSLMYVPHKSWYSWIIQSLVNGVYAFGFLFMLPQLFINYKLKSVAHLPWRAFMYKAFNTFIDDLFAFIITMPTAHRVACFRDDIVFVIYLYQKWLYPVDQSRLNEYGQRGEVEDAKKIKVEDAKKTN